MTPALYAGQDPRAQAKTTGALVDRIEKPFEPVAVPGRTRRPLAVDIPRAAWNIGRGLLGLAFLFYIAAMVVLFVMGWQR